MSGSQASTSIRGTLTSVLLWGAGLFIALVSFVLDTTLTGFLAARFDAEMMKRAQVLTTLTKVDFEDGIEFDYSGEFMPEFEEPEGPEFFEVYLPDGQLLERSESLDGNGIHVEAAFTLEPVFSKITIDEVGWCRLLRMSFRPQHEDLDLEGSLEVESPEECLTLMLAHRLDEHKAVLRVIRAMIWGSFALLLLLVIVLVRIALGKGLSPLDEISHQVAAIETDDLSTRVTPSRAVRELIPVVDQLNALLVRLERMVARERRFTSDVAHELRTPLTELRTLAEVGDRNPDDRAMVVAFFQDVREITIEMQSLVTALLALSRCDSGSLVLAPERVDLTAACEKAWRRVASIAGERGISLEKSQPSPLAVVTDRAMVEQIVQNLMSNAVTYSPEGSTVRIDGGPNHLSMSNPAPNLEEGDLEPMFEPFWQKDSARTGGAHSGLGLALVRAYATRLDIALSNRLENGILSFRLEFPLGLMQN